MRPPIRFVGCLAAVLLLLQTATPAHGAYVLFFQAIGGWSVLCWRDEPTANVSCSADAPPPALGNAPATVIHVTETHSGAFGITVEMRASVPVGAIVSIGVDGGGGMQAPLDRHYRAHLDGDAAGRLVTDMLAGRHLIIDAPAYGAGAPTEVIISLDTFAQAFAVMRTKLRAYGAISDP